MLLRQSLLILTAGLLLAADEPKTPTAEQEAKKLEGTWKVVSSERDGKPDEAAKNAVTTFQAGGKLTVKYADGSGGNGTYTLDPSKDPKAIDLVIDFGAHKGMTFPGIYLLEGDTLKVCRAEPGKDRPTEFATKADSGLMSFVLQREKPVPPPPPFPDKHLEAAVRAILHEEKGELTEERLRSLSVLEGGKEIRDLSGLEKCKNLALIKLPKNHIVDLTPLKDLASLQSLDLSGNQIQDLKPLAGLTKLQYLELSNNQIEDLSPLRGLTHLSGLYLGGNKVKDLAPLSELTTLSSLSVPRNEVRDLAPLEKVTRLSLLDLKDNQVEDLTPLGKQTELRLLMLDRNKIADLAPLVAAAKADAEGSKRFAPYLRLYLSGNPLSETAKSEQLTALKGFGVRIEP
jgi:uncharacterized protein (TIGR03067 family)